VKPNGLPDMLRPFTPGRDTPQDMGLGGLSTEYLATVQNGKGEWVNIPLIWWDTAGQPHLMSEDEAIARHSDWELSQGVRAPRFDNLGVAELSARNRSAAGGATETPLYRSLKK